MSTEAKPFRVEYRETPIDGSKGRKVMVVIHGQASERDVRIEFWNKPCWSRVDTQKVEILSVTPVEDESITAPAE